MKLKKRHEGYLSPFQKEKLKEIAQLVREGENPLRAEIATSQGSFRFTKDDVRAFHEQTKQRFYMIVRYQHGPSQKNTRPANLPDAGQERKAN